MIILWFAALLMGGFCVEYQNSYGFPTAPPLICGDNEKPSKCRVICPPQTCDSIFTTYNCEGKNCCEPGCDCLDGYLRNANEDCVPSEECFVEPKCNVPVKCRQTCAVPNPPGCPNTPSETNEDGCKCRRGFVLTKPGGKCIPIENCPTNLGCNGDPNAVIKKDPKPCPSTCDAPNAFPCKKASKPVGCECKPGFILSAPDGICIRPDNCEYGNPCGPNGTFVPCRYICPNSFCPKNDSRDKPICKPPPPSDCFSGCICKLNYRLLSRENQICIRSDHCPRVKCTRRDEHWNSCPEECNSGYCQDVDKPRGPCNTFAHNCRPQCVCDDGYFRNPETNLCVSAEECRKI